MWQVRRATWQEWTAGSRLFFWRGPTHFRKQARDGITPYVLGALPENLEWHFRLWDDHIKRAM